MPKLEDLIKSRSGKGAGLNFAITVKVVIKESNKALPGAQVYLYDNDKMGKDDLLGHAISNASGISRFVFGADHFRDRFDKDDLLRLMRGEMKFPDLYTVVADADGNSVLSTHHQNINDIRRTNLQVVIPFETALQHGLIKRKPGPSINQKREHWHDTWKKILDKQPPGSKPPIDFCFLRLILDVMSGLDAPNENFQKQAAKILNGRASSEQLKQLSQLGREGVAMVDRLGVASSECSSKMDPKELAEMLLRDGGPLEKFGQNLMSPVPPPDFGLPDPREGEAFMVPWTDWDKYCGEDFRVTRDHGVPWSPPHTPQGLNDMQEYWYDQLSIMEQPSINQVEAYDPIFQDYVRLADVWNKLLTVVDYDAIEGRRDLDLNMNVPLSDSSCLYKHADPANSDPGAHQALVIDVKSGQTVVFKGSGFISMKAKIRSQFARWESTTFDADGRLVPKAFGPAPALNDKILDVFGHLMPHDGYTSQTYTGDWVLLEWPDTEPGLYKVTLEFANEQGLAIAAHQDHNTCELDIEGRSEVSTQTLWFAVIPEKEPQRIRIRATRLTCVDEKDPESFIINLFDDINLRASAFYSKYVWENNDIRATDSTPTNSSDDHEFWDDGDSWNVAMNVFPSDGTFHTLELNEVAYATFLAAEVFGDFDRALMQLVIVTIAAIVLVILVAALAAIIVALIAAEVITVGLATVLLGTGGVIPVVAAFLFGAFFKEIVAAVTAMMSGITGTDLVAIGEPVISGAEIAERLSPLRVHRLIPRATAESSTASGPLRVAAEAEFAEGEFKYEYECINTDVNSTYRIHVEVERAWVTIIASFCLIR